MRSEKAPSLRGGLLISQIRSGSRAAGHMTLPALSLLSDVAAPRQSVSQGVHRRVTTLSVEHVPGDPNIPMGTVTCCDLESLLGIEIQFLVEAIIPRSHVFYLGTSTDRYATPDARKAPPKQGLNLRLPLESWRLQ